MDEDSPEPEMPETIDGNYVSPEEALRRMGITEAEAEKAAATATGAVPDDFDFEAQDFTHMARRLPEPTTIAGVKCIIQDLGDTKSIINAAGDGTPENIKTFVLKHVVRPDLAKHWDGFSSGAQIAWMNGVMTELGVDESFFSDTPPS